jgi:hypothetical protein
MTRQQALYTSPRSIFYLLTNVDEYPEVLLTAKSIVNDKIEMAYEKIAQSAETEAIRKDPASVSQLITMFDNIRSAQVLPWHVSSRVIDPHVVKVALIQYAPTALLLGCWLQQVLRVPMAATPAGARLSTLYKHQLDTFCNKNSFIVEYRELLRQLALTLPDVSSQSFVEISSFEEFSFSLPSLLLSIGQFPRTYLPELLGVHLGWQHLGLNAVGSVLVSDARRAHSLAKLEACNADFNEHETGCALALDAVVKTCADLPTRERSAFWNRICIGAFMIASIWSEWISCTRALSAIGPITITEAMIEILRKKAPHAFGYHGNKQISGERIDSLLFPDNFQPYETLEKLATSRFVVPGKPDKSDFCNGLVGWGGPMHSVFSTAELDIIRAWVQSLPTTTKQVAAPPKVTTHIFNDPQVNGGSQKPFYSKIDFSRPSEAALAKCSVREMYYRLVNLEDYPEILPRAEQLVRDRLDRSMATLRSRLRPIPSMHYSPEVLDNWVHKKHREQVDEYPLFNGKPSVSLDTFIYNTVQLAPLILIDGAWLQGMLTHNCVHTETGRILFQILYEEAGEGDHSRHHANIYRDLLKNMGIELPAIESTEFIRWAPLLDSSFEIPVFWMSISCFPRHFLPEILGLNLAVELAGIGGQYMHARDTLRYFNLPTLFVDVHLAADNVSQGHTAKSVTAIKSYMDQISAREGPHNSDAVWRRIWSGVRSTLPQIGRTGLFAHRIRNLFGGTIKNEAPRIFVG